jgi:hypothetical protein
MQQERVGSELAAKREIMPEGMAEFVQRLQLAVYDLMEVPTDE